MWSLGCRVLAGQRGARERGQKDRGVGWGWGHRTARPLGSVMEGLRRYRQVSCHLPARQIRWHVHTPAAQFPPVPRHAWSSKGGGGRKGDQSRALPSPTPREEGPTSRDEVKVGWNPES